MSELNIIIDPLTGAVLVEGPEPVSPHVLDHLRDALGPGRAIACAARPAMRTPAAASSEEVAGAPCVRIAGYYHNSLIEGLGGAQQSSSRATLSAAAAALPPTFGIRVAGCSSRSIVWPLPCSTRPSSAMGSVSWKASRSARLRGCGHWFRSYGARLSAYPGVLGLHLRGVTAHGGEPTDDWCGAH